MLNMKNDGFASVDEGSWKSADKPGSVRQPKLPGSHSSGRRVAAAL